MNYDIAAYYKDWSIVHKLATVKWGPWGIACPHCETMVEISELDTWTDCLCGMHRFMLLSKQPEIKVNKKHEAVDAYYRITGLRYNSSGWEEEIQGTVTNVDFWRRVIKGWLGRGNNPKNVPTMLKYYVEGRLPGTRLSAREVGSEIDPDAGWGFLEEDDDD